MPTSNRDPAFQEVEATGRLAQLLAYWRGLRPGTLPTRADVDIMDISAALLPYIFLADVLDDGKRFRWRLIGTHIVRHAGTDDTGLDLEISIAASQRATIIGHYRTVVTERRAICHRSRFVGSDGRPYRYDRLLLPVLSADSGQVDTILGGAIFADEG